MPRAWIEDVVELNAQFARTCREARQYPHLHFYRQEKTSGARDTYAQGLRDLGVRCNKRDQRGLVGI